MYIVPSRIAVDIIIMSSKGPKNVVAKARKNKVIRDSIKGISKPAIERLLRRGGVLRIGNLAYDDIRNIIRTWTAKVVKDMILFTQHNRRKTVSIEDLEAALDNNGVSLAAGLNSNAKSTASLQSCNSRGISGKARAPAKEGEVKKPHRFLPGTVAMRDVRRHQKNSDCLAIPKLNFERLTREIAQDMGESIRFSNGVFDLLQLALEDYIIKLGKLANKCVIHAKRETLFSSDLELVSIIKEGNF